MNIVDYATLQSGVADYLNRSDLTTRTLDFIGMAEVRLMDELRSTGLLEKEITESPAAGVRTIALPADFKEPLNLWFNNGVDRQPLRYVPAALLDVWTTEGRPFHWTIDGSNLAFERPTDQSYTFAFRYVIDLALSDSATTNSLLTQYPNLYLFASLVEAAPYLQDDNALQRWEGRYQQALANAKRRQARLNSQTTLSTEVAYNNRPRYGFNVYRGY